MAEGKNVLIPICEVLSIDDEQGGGRIKVRLKPEDNHILNIDDLPYAFPLLPKMFYVKPKVGEAVFVFTAEKDGNKQRFYIGPIISQLNHMSEEPFMLDAMTMFQGSYTSPQQNIDMNPESKGAFPEETDISVMGRNITDLQLTDDDVRLRAGVKLTKSDSKDVVFNTKDPSYVKLKYHKDKDTDVDGYKSTATVVADKINLIGNNSKHSFNTTDRKELITDEEIERFIEEAYSVPYGEILVKFLNLFRTAFLTHVHPYPTMPPCSTEVVKEVSNTVLENMLSDSVKLN